MRRLTILTTALALALAGCGDDEEKTDQPAPAAGGGPCAGVPAGKPGEDRPKPAKKLDASRRYRLEFATSQGAFTVDLDPKQSPNASASLVSLACSKFFDGTKFHRIVPDFVIQGGDPTGSGSGGPGYSTQDTPPPNAAYTKGVVAMAKTAAEAPGTAGSQFYVVTGQDAGLPPDYAIVGKVSEGMEVVDKIGALGDPATEQPTKDVTIESVRVEEG